MNLIRTPLSRLEFGFGAPADMRPAAGGRDAIVEFKTLVNRSLVLERISDGAHSRLNPRASNGTVAISRQIATKLFAVKKCSR